MLPLAVFVLVLVLPVLEIFVIIQVGQAIGGWETVLLLVAGVVAGTWVIRHEGRRAWRRLNETLDQGLMPDRELIDAVLIMLGGVLLIAPGFITDFLGLLCVLPFTRPLVRGLLLAWAARRLARAGGPPPMFPGGFGPPGGPDRQEEIIIEREVIQGEVIREDDAQEGEEDGKDGGGPRR